MSKEYNAESIEVLSGLDPVRRRPGMYTDTTRPNHLVQEVLDNSVDEALAGHARNIEVTVYKDGMIEVSDDGRGMPVDIHPEEKVSGVELILTRLHAGGKFSNDNYRFSGGLHGVGVSVVNALSKQLEVLVKRNGNLYRMTFASGDKTSELEIVDKVGQRNTGTTVRFLPDTKYFDSPNLSLSRLVHVLRAKAVLCPPAARRIAATSGTTRTASLTISNRPRWTTPACPPNPLPAVCRATMKPWTGPCCGCQKVASSLPKAT
jgi:topoisomerase-4 subunit B